MSGETAIVQQDTDPYKGEREGKLREVGGQAVWSLSSCKPGRIQMVFLASRSQCSEGYTMLFTILYNDPVISWIS